MTSNSTKCHGDEEAPSGASYPREPAKSPAKPAQGGSLPENAEKPGGADPRDIVEESSQDSFPASDPPNWATGQQRDPA